MSGEDSFAQANEAFINDDYETALELYNRAIAANTTNANFYDKRAATNLKLKHYNEALTDANSALAIEPTSNSALHRRGTALFHLDRFREAKESFESAERFGNKNSQIAIRKCDAELARVSDIDMATTTSTAVSPSVSAPTASPAPAAPPVSAGPMASKVTFSFFQTPTTVTLTIYAKNSRKDTVSVTLSPSMPNELSAKLTMSDDSVYERAFHLFAPVQSTIQTAVTAYKVEVTMQKEIKDDWPSLELPAGASPAAATALLKRENVIREDAKLTTYPSSARRHTDFNEVEAAAKKAEEEEKPEGEAALQKLFQQIYKDADDDTRRAMIKSFQTSGGTVLSTNWKEVKDKNYETDITPPAGQEVRRWNK